MYYNYNLISREELCIDTHLVESKEAFLAEVGSHPAVLPSRFTNGVFKLRPQRFFQNETSSVGRETQDELLHRYTSVPEYLDGRVLE